MEPNTVVNVIPVRYEQSNFFRTIHADGAYGGVTAMGKVRFSFWNERGAVPGETRLTVSGNDMQEDVVRGGNALVRELEVDVAMDISAAESFHAWLGQQIETAKRNAQANANQAPRRQ